MNRKKEILISIVINILTLGFIYSLNTLTNREMTMENRGVKKLKHATFAELKEKMLSVNWRWDTYYPNSLFDANDFHNNFFHAGIYRFDEVGYLMTTYGYIRAHFLQRQIRKNLVGTWLSKPYID